MKGYDDSEAALDRSAFRLSEMKFLKAERRSPCEGFFSLWNKILSFFSVVEAQAVNKAMIYPWARHPAHKMQRWKNI